MQARSKQLTVYKTAGNTKVREEQISGTCNSVAHTLKRIARGVPMLSASPPTLVGLRCWCRRNAGQRRYGAFRQIAIGNAMVAASTI